TFEVITSNDPLPKDLSSYSLALQCGGCMVTRRQIKQRLKVLKASNVAVTNYGMAIKKIKNTQNKTI
ncbi:MAG: [FeFe] hydrogenase H-cluster maturation GTPase HydF, partial [Rikenellaceae bacterium]